MRLKEKYDKIPDLTVDILSKPSAPAQPIKKEKSRKHTREAKQLNDRSIGDNSSETHSAKLSHRSKRTGMTQHSFRKPVTYLEKYDHRSDDEVVRDRQDFEKYFDIYTDELQKEAKTGLNLQKRLTQSFDTDVLREMYDGDFGVESCFNSEGSWISFPPQNAFMEDPNNLAKLALFREKIKSKFNFMNVVAEAHPPRPVT